MSGEITYPFQTSTVVTVQPLKFEMDKWFHPTLYEGCNYLYMLRPKLIYVGKRAPSELARNMYMSKF